MKIYRYSQTPKFSLDDEKLIGLIRYVNTFIGNMSRCCYPSIEHEIRDLSNLRFISGGRVLTRGRGIYTRVPFCEDLEIYFRHTGLTNKPRLIVNNNGSYTPYEPTFCSQPIFLIKLGL